MTTITLDDNLVQQVMRAGHYADAQTAVLTVLQQYLQRQSNPSLFDELRVPEALADDELAASLSERHTDKTRDVEL